MGRLPVSQNAYPIVKETKSLGRLSVSQASDSIAKEIKPLTTTGSVPSTPQRVVPSTGPKLGNTGAIMKRSSAKTQSSPSIQIFVPKNSTRPEPLADIRKESSASGRSTPFSMHSKAADAQKLSNSREESDRSNSSVESGTGGYKSTGLSEASDQNFTSAIDGINPANPVIERNVMDVRCVGPGKHIMNSSMEPPPSYPREPYDTRVHKTNRNISVEVSIGGRTRSLVSNWEKREASPSYEGPTSSNSSETTSATTTPSLDQRGRAPSAEMETVLASDEDVISDLMEQHNEFLGSMQSRLTKLQVIRRYLERKDFKAAISAMEKMADHAIVADVISVLAQKADIITLDLCACLLPLLACLLESNMDGHLSISLEMLVKLIRVYGHVIHSTLSASSSVGVDLQQEQRLERCNLIFIELEKIKRCLPSLTRRGGSVAKSAQELSLALQEIL